MCHRKAVAPIPENGAPGKVIYLGACLIAAVRLAREEDWRNSPRVAALCRILKSKKALPLPRKIGASNFSLKYAGPNFSNFGFPIRTMQQWLQYSTYFSQLRYFVVKCVTLGGRTHSVFIQL
jgi:hypothetical protein